MKTQVVFRKWKAAPHTVIALFPLTPANNDPWCMLSYEHVGQHGAASSDITRLTSAATTEEAAPLKAELERIGYDLEQVRRVPWNAFKIRKDEINAIK